MDSGDSRKEIYCQITGEACPADEVVVFQGFTVGPEGKHILVERLRAGDPLLPEEGMVFRTNTELAMHPQAKLPARCIRCGQDNAAFQEWHYAAAPRDRIVLSRKELKVSVPMCQLHQAKMLRSWIWIGLAGLAGVTAIIISFLALLPWLLLPGLGLILWATYKGRRAKGLRLREWRDGLLFFRGANDAFLRHLPVLQQDSQAARRWTRGQ